MNLNSELDSQESITLDFNLHFQDNSLLYDDDKEKELNQRQLILHTLILYMHEESFWVSIIFFAIGTSILMKIWLGINGL